MARILGVLFLFLAVSPWAQGEWKYRAEITKEKGTLSTVQRPSDVERISLKQLCFAYGCKAQYQWSNFRVIVSNPKERHSAIVSALTHTAIVDGQVVSFKADVLSDAKDGYVLPMDLAQSLVEHLELGTLEYRETVKPTPKPSSKARPLVLTLVIDPGHGGSDWGTGFGSLFEKDIALLYAQKIRQELESTASDVNVIMTRETDGFVSLSDRAKIANENNATLFLSLHVNHAPNANIAGVESYILSPDATDDDARKLALLENETWLKTSKIKPNAAGTDISKILIDMEQTRYIQDSARAAALVQQELASLDKRFGLKNRGVKQALFYVLSQVAMPSTLVEMGFLSNAGDRSRLMNVAFRDEFAKSVVTAIKRYRDKVLKEGNS